MNRPAGSFKPPGRAGPQPVDGHGDLPPRTPAGDEAADGSAEATPGAADSLLRQKQMRYGDFAPPSVRLSQKLGHRRDLSASSGAAADASLSSVIVNGNPPTELATMAFIDCGFAKASDGSSC